MWQQSFPEKKNDDDGAHQQRDSDECEFEEAEGAYPESYGDVGEQHVHRGPCQREQRTGVGREDEREKELRWRTTANRHQDDYRKQSRYGTVEADQARSETRPTPS